MSNSTFFGVSRPCVATLSSNHPIVKIRLFLLGLVSIIAFGTATTYADQTWDPAGIDGDWNNSANWLPDGRVPTAEQAFIESNTGNIATISSDFIATPTDIKVGNNGATARLDHIAGTAQGGAGNWSFVGFDDPASNGTYNLADTTSAGPGISGWAQGSGSLTVEQLRIGYKGNGVVNMNTTGSLTAIGFLDVGDSENEAPVSGTLNLESGTIVTSGDFGVGQNGGTGALAMTGGMLDLGGQLWFGQNSGGMGTWDFSGGVVNTNSWVTVGRDGGTGVVNQTGGTLIFNDPGNDGKSLLVGQKGPGTWTINGGIVDIQSGLTEIGEDSIGELNLNGGQWNTPTFLLGEFGGGDGTLNLNGGDLHTAGIEGGIGFSTVNFDGSQITANGNGTVFIHNIVTPTILAGGLKVHTAGFDLSGSSPITGMGDVIKTGVGSLGLLGENDYSGKNIVKGGTLQVAAHSAAGTGDFDVTAGGGMGVRPIALNDQISPGNVDFSGAGNLDIDFGNLMGMVPTTAPLSTNLHLGGPTTVNVDGTLFAIGTIPLVDYASKTGPGSFSLGALPPGVEASLSDSGSQLSLMVTSVGIKPQWNGDVSQFWDTVTSNWLDQASLTPTIFTDGDPVLFEDSATDPTVVLNQMVMPSIVEFKNDILPYTLSGTGTISGSTNFIKSLNENLTITGLFNDYTGSTTVEGGTLSVDSIADGGVASSIGASTADSSNLVLAGGTLDYAGTVDTTTDRGFTIAAPGSRIVNEKNIEFSGDIVSTSGEVTKTGSGELRFSNPGSIEVGDPLPDSPALIANEGTITFDGSGSQVVTVGGDLFVNDGSVPAPTAPTVLALIDTTVNADFLELNKGEIATTFPTKLLLTNSTLNSTAFRTGNDPSNLSAFGAQAVIEQMDSDWSTPNEVVLSDTFDAKTTWTLSGSSTVAFDRMITGVGSASTADIVVEDNAVMTRNAPNGWISIGNSNGGQGFLTIRDNGALNMLGTADLNMGDGGAAVGTLNVQDSGSVNSPGQIFVGKNDATGIINLTGGTITGGSWINIAGVAAASTGTVNVSGGHLQHTAATEGGSNINIADHGIGEMNVSGTGMVSSPNVITLANNPTGLATLNLSGNGLIVTPGVVRRQGAGDIFFDGGTLRANADSGADPVLSADLCELLAGGGTIDSSTYTITTAQAIIGTGGLTKAGSGTLFLDGNSTFTGATTVSEGILGGSGSVAGELVVSSGATIAPGKSVGSFGAGDTTIDGNYAYEIDGTASDTLVVTGNLTLDGASTLTITQLSPASEASYTVATYTGTITGTFGGGVIGLPSGYSVDYAFGGNSIALVSTGASPYDTWIDSYYPGETDPMIIGMNADPDKDGQNNKVEFALGGAPDNPSDNAKIYSLVEDSDADVDPDAELLTTIAVRAGTPAFSGSPSPTASHDGCTYIVDGSADLYIFTSPVSVVPTPVTTGLPPVPAGYEYRTFSLDGSTGTLDQGNLRTRVTY